MVPQSTPLLPQNDGDEMQVTKKKVVFKAVFCGQNILRRRFHLLGLSDSPLCRWCAAEEETSAHILCECEPLASHSSGSLGSFFLEPEDVKFRSLGANWNFSKATGIP